MGGTWLSEGPSHDGSEWEQDRRGARPEGDHRCVFCGQRLTAKEHKAGKACDREDCQQYEKAAKQARKRWGT